MTELIRHGQSLIVPQYTIQKDMVRADPLASQIEGLLMIGSKQR